MSARLLHTVRVLTLGAVIALGGFTPGCPPRPTDCSDADAVDTVALQTVASGLVAPSAMAAPDDGTGRLFILDQIGRIRVIDNQDRLLGTPLLDVSDRMPPIGIDFGNGVVFDERGLLGIALHPDFASNGRFFIFYTIPKAEGDPEAFNARNRVSEFRIASPGGNVADPASERVLLEILKPQFNHNGGQLAFGPDGFLYIGVGDGGGANDVGDGHNAEIGNAQDLTTLLGKILRIDVDGGDPYGIPDDNPFVDDANARPEIFAFGVRNPWRFSFDADGRLFVADVGQDLFEEINIVERGGNYGWRVREGLHCFDPDNPGTPPANCAASDDDGRALRDPILEYPHSAEERPFGISVTGGFVYRGTAIACLRGEYVFGDWSGDFVVPDGSLFAARENDAGQWTMRELQVADDADGRLGRFILSFGEDTDGELYILTSENLGPFGETGRVFRLVAEE